ncbi:hypothetical protein [Nocardioides campestrisoli]|uniref:hypothetical protein n=1 Tax=Nocardioides campestrisoli TaxID=2736757 RepID=UPI0015E6D640|nr:hypothetical protein [Nocardioides campestrisoli]
MPDSPEPPASELLERALDDLNIWEAVLLATRDPHGVLDVVMAAADPEAAVAALSQRFSVSEIQAEAMLALQVRRVTARDRAAIEAKHDELAAMVAGLRAQVAGDQPGS